MDEPRSAPSRNLSGSRRANANNEKYLRGRRIPAFQGGVLQRTLVYAPRAQRDLVAIPKRHALQVLEDLQLLQKSPWPPGKVKRLRGREFWEIKTGDYRTIFWPDGRNVVVLRVVNRRDLERTLGRIDVRALLEELGEHGRGGG